MPLKILFILLFLMLSGCGYHLRGDITLPQDMEAIYVESASGTLQQELKNALRSSSGKLVNSASEAELVIKFSKDEISSRVVSINAAGRANQFQLNYQLIFSIYDAAGKALLSDQNVNVKREYFNDQTDILGKSNEEGVIRNEMVKQAVSSVISRISAATEAKAK